jgi:hypothetical protein
VDFHHLVIGHARHTKKEINQINERSLRYVTPRGEISNFLLEDYDLLEKFIEAQYSLN